VRTGTARVQREADPHHGRSRLIRPRLPHPAGLDDRAAGDLLVPHDREGPEIEALAIASPPAAVRQHRAEQVDGMFSSAGDQQRSVDVAGIDQVSFRRQAALSQSILNRCRHLNVAQASDGGLDIRDQVGRVPIARLGQVDLVADPAGLALPGVANVWIVALQLQLPFQVGGDDKSRIDAALDQTPGNATDLLE
jgi:hypothetical protein